MSATTSAPFHPSTDPSHMPPVQNPDDYAGNTVIIIGVTFSAMMTLVLFVRFFTRVHIIGHIGVDDTLIGIAGLCNWAFVIATIYASRYGLGRHLQFILSEDMVKELKFVWLCAIFYNSCLFFIKSSVLALYLRLGDPGLRRAAIIMIFVVTVQFISNEGVCIFMCTPIRDAWSANPNANCINRNIFYLANAGINICTDLIVYLLPIKLVVRLRVSRRQKIALGIMLCLGLVACLASIIRITFIPRMLYGQDITWDMVGAMYWSAIETNVGIIAASIPSFKALAKRYVPRLLGSSYKDQKYPSTSFHKRVSTQGWGKIGSPRKRGIGTQNGLSTLNMSRTMTDPTEMDTIDYSKMGDFKKGAVLATTIEQHDGNSDEEPLACPEGRIVATTQITMKTQTEEEVEHEASFYDHEVDIEGTRAYGRGRRGTPKSSIESGRRTPKLSISLERMNSRRK